MSTSSSEPAVQMPETGSIDLATLTLSPRANLWITVASFAVSILTVFVVESYALAVVLGFATRHALPMILGTRGESRKVALGINLLLIGGLLAAVAAAYNARAILQLLGLV